MTQRFSFRWVLCTLVSTALGCAPSGWSTTRADLDRVPLSGWAGGDDVFLSGGALGSSGQALVLHSAGGGAFEELPVNSTATLWWAFGLSPTDVYFVGEGGTILHYDGTSFSPMDSTTQSTLYGIWGTSPDDLWAVGGRPDVDGVILHKDETGFHAVTGLAASGAFFKVWGSGANDVFVCGQGGTMLHWGGGTFTPQDAHVGSGVSLFTVAGRSSTDVYAVGGAGLAVAVHYDGQTWMPVADTAVAQAGGLAGVAVADDGTVVMVGEGGTKLRGLPGRIVDESTHGRVSADLHGAVYLPHRDELYAVGGNYNAPAPAARTGVIQHFVP